MNHPSTFGEAAVETLGDGFDLLWLVFFIVVLMPVWLMAGAVFLVYVIGRLTVAAVRGFLYGSAPVS